jgi:hypothetical protein
LECSSQVGRPFKTITDEETIMAIAREAESICYAHNTLKKVVRMKTQSTGSAQITVSTERSLTNLTAGTVILFLELQVEFDI